MITRRFLIAIFLCFSVPSVAFAHPLVDEARAAYDEADFEGALDALTRAEASAGLERADLVSVYELRILVHLGMGSSDAVETDIRRLLSIAPAHDFGDSVPPEVLEQANQARAELRGPITVTARASADAAGVTIRAEVHDDPMEIVRQVSIGTRRGDGPFRRTRGTEAQVPAGEDVAFYAVAIGPGGVVLSEDGSEEDPRVWEGADASGGIPWLWVGLGAAGVAVAAAVVIIIVVAAGGSSEQTTPSLPMVSFE